jgi:uncharacterized protein YdhG (YjbR/CyaY superfamily)
MDYNPGADRIQEERTVESDQPEPTTVDEYISQFPPDVRQILLKLRTLCKEHAPQAEERYAYRMPGYYLNGPLVYFAAFKRHIGLFPTAADLGPFESDLSGYKRSKGTIQFPLDNPIPYDLVARIVDYRVAQNLAKSK